MLTRGAFAERFGLRAVFGMVHLKALPGSPLFRGSMQEVIALALEDARVLRDGGCAGLVFENFGDRPFFKDSVKAVTVAAMTRAIVEVTGEVQLPFGVNVLRNDAASAVSIAAAAGAAFIRVNIHTGAMITDQGIIEGHAADTLRLRSALAPDVAIFADHLVKHAVPLGVIDPMQSARDLRMRGLADALILTGVETGAPPEPSSLSRLREAIDAPLLIGSGLSEDNTSAFADADGAIVGTAMKRGGDIDQPVMREKVERIVARFRSSGDR
jgi:membrane complex biogenesis BtpA family protein